MAFSSKSRTVRESRTERDFLGEREIPRDAYYGIQSVRGQENFDISPRPPHPAWIHAIGDVKYACAKANVTLGNLSEPIGQAILRAASEVSEGELDHDFIVSGIQGGAGTSLHMNANEVIANRALELLGSSKGDYGRVHPNTHVNMAQSTNDVMPTALRIALLRITRRTLAHLNELAGAFKEKADEFADVLKVGRTHLQDAVPIALGQEFGAYGRVVERDVSRIEEATEGLLTVNLGATAVGTGLNADPEYVKLAIGNLAERTEFPLSPPEDLVDLTQNVDPFLHLSAAVRTAASNLSKVAGDLRLMASGPRNGLGEITLPPVQPGSSIMPGKVNPVIPEAVNQAAFHITGNDLTVLLAVQNGQLELNVMLPVLALNLLESIEMLGRTSYMLSERCVRGISANRARCAEEVEKTVGVATALNPYIGYEAAVEVAQKSLETGKTVREVVVAEGLISNEQVDVILSPDNMVRPRPVRPSEAPRVTPERDSGTIGRS